MSYNIIVLDSFKKEFKNLFKKYKNIKQDIKRLSLELKNDPRCGICLFGNCYKIRVANSSIPTGKRGGFRVIYYIVDKKDDIYLISIYSKRDIDSINDEKIIAILKENGL